MQSTSLLVMIIFSVLGAILGGLATILWLKWRSRQFRIQHAIPSVIGQWRCQWFDDTLDPSQPKVEDILEIQRWTHNGEFQAQGHQPEFHLSYPMVGEIDASRVITLVYKAARYPYELNRGVVCLELSRDGEMMEGRWFGRRSSNRLGGGKVRCLRVIDTAKAA